MYELLLTIIMVKYVAARKISNEFVLKEFFRVDSSEFSTAYFSTPLICENATGSILLVKLNKIFEGSKKPVWNPFISRRRSLARITITFWCIGIKVESLHFMV